MDKVEDSQLKVSRTFEADQETLWKAWSEPERFKQWYGPKGFTIPVCEIDFQVGGQHLWSMKSPDGMEMFYIGEYKEITPMERLVYSDSMADAEGNLMDPAAMGMPEGSTMTMDVTVTFAHTDGKTTVTVSHISSGENDPAAMGWEMAFEKLADSLSLGMA
jgi:uncharacterized protein YndB with AHSA1/START domain